MDKQKAYPRCGLMGCFILTIVILFLLKLMVFSDLQVHLTNEGFISMDYHYRKGNQTIHSTLTGSSGQY